MTDFSLLGALPYNQALTVVYVAAQRAVRLPSAIWMGKGCAVSETILSPRPRGPGVREAADLDRRAVVERDGDCAVGVDGGVVDEGSSGFGRVADCRVLTAVLVERGDGRTLGFELV